MIKTDETFKIDYVDPSSISKFNRCPAAFLFSRLMGLSLPDSSQIYLDYGTDMHVALPHCYGGDYEHAANLFDERWDLRPYGNTDKKRNKERARESLKEFCSLHCPGVCPYKIIKLDIKAPTHDEIGKDEVPFLIDIGGELSLAGRIDAPVEWNADKSLWALDYKTASEISARYFDNFNNCPQAIAYTLALSQLTGKRVVGLLVEAVRVSAVKAESVIGLTFVREHQIKSFIDQANACAHAILGCNKLKTWPKNCTGCAPYSMFGQPGRYCEFKMLCDSPDWKDTLKFYTRQEPFHPFRVKK